MLKKALKALAKAIRRLWVNGKEMIEAFAMQEQDADDRAEADEVFNNGVRMGRKIAARELRAETPKPGLVRRGAGAAAKVATGAAGLAGAAALLPFKATGKVLGAVLGPVLGAGGGGGGAAPETARALADQAAALQAIRQGSPAPAPAERSVAFTVAQVARKMAVGSEVPQRLLAALDPVHAQWLAGLKPDELERLARADVSKVDALLSGRGIHGVPTPADVMLRAEREASSARVAESRFARRIAKRRAGRGGAEPSIEADDDLAFGA